MDIQHSITMEGYYHKNGQPSNCRNIVQALLHIFDFIQRNLCETLFLGVSHPALQLSNYVFSNVRVAEKVE